MSLSSRQHPPPSSWQDFESLCAQLWGRIWKVDTVQRFGRSGQRQNGVDIFGRPQGGIEGIQCKLKDTTIGKVLTLKEIEQEIEKAKSFAPPLTRLIFATTAPPDADLTGEVLKIAEAHRQASLFDVVLLSWPDLIDRIAQYPDLAEAYGGHAKTILETNSNVLDVKETVDKMAQGQAEVLALVRGMHEKLLQPQPPNIDDLLSTEIDRYRDLLRSNKAALALELLEGLRKARWNEASTWSKYRILTNIAASKTRLGRIEGANDYIAALAYDPDGEQAICNAAYGHLLKDAFDEARKLARHAIEKFPKSVSAHAILLAATSGIGDVGDPLSLVPGEMHENPAIAFGFGIFYRKKGDAAAARCWFANAFDKDPKQPEIKGAFAEQLLTDVLADQAAIAGRQLSAAQRADLDSAERLLDEIWFGVKETDVAPLHIAVAMNLSTARRLQGNSASAARVLDEALRAEPDEPKLRVQRAFVARELNDFQTGLKMLEGVGGAGVPVAPLLRAEILMLLNRPDEALKAADGAIEGAATSDIAIRGRRLRVAILRKLHGTDAALEAARSLASEHPSTILSRIALAEALYVHGDEPQALDTARTIKRGLPPGATPEERLALASLLAQLRAFDEGADIYGALVNEARDGPVFRQWVACLVNSDRRGEVLHAVDRLPAADQDLPFYLKARAAAYERAGDRTKAREFYDRCVAADPSDVKTALRRILLLHHMGERDLVLQGLDAIHLPEEPSAFDLMAIAHMRAECGQLEEAVRIGYRARRIGFKERRIHQAYMELILLRLPSETHFLEIDRITPDAAFSLRDANGPEVWFVVEPDHPDRRLGEIAPDSPIARGATGKVVGETVVLAETDLKRDERKVAAIKHRAVHALHQTMEHFEEWFPGEPGLIRVPIRQDESGKVDLSDMEKLLRASSRQAEEVEAQYRAGRLPVPLMAQLLSVNPIDAWRSISADPSINVRCCVGRADERTQAIDLIRSKPKWIVDSITLVTMHALAIHDEILAVAGCLGTCQSSLDLFDEVVRDRRHGTGQPYLRLGMVDGQIVMVKLTPEMVESDARFLKDIRDWAKAKLKIVPAMGVRNRRPDERVSDILGRAFDDIIRAAEGDNRCILSEDLLFRAIACQVGGISGAWIQAFLMVAAEDGVLPLDRYDDAVAGLIAAKHTFTSINTDSLFRVAEKAAFQPTPKFHLLARMLGRPETIPVERFQVGASFLARVWAQPIEQSSKRDLTFAVLDALTQEERWRMPAAVRYMELRADQMPARADLYQALRDWRADRFPADQE